MYKKLTIKVPKGETTEEINKALTPNDRPITERIKTFEDAVEELGDWHPLVTEYKLIAGAFDITNDLLAYLELRIICEALNEGWRPAFNKDKFYSPWFYVHLENKPKNNKYSYYGVNTHGGYVCAQANYAGTHAVTYYGMQLVLRTKELAEYCGKQFIDIWISYLFDSNI